MPEPMVRGDRGSIPSRVIPKSQKMVPDAALLKTQDYNVRIKGKVAQSKEWRSSPLHLKDGYIYVCILNLIYIYIFYI